MKPLSEILKSGHRIAPPPATAEPERVTRAAASIRRRWPDAEVEDPETDAQALASNMERRRKRDDWRGFNWADATRTAQAFFGSPLWRKRHFRPLLDFLIDQIGPGCTPAYVRAAFRKYLDTFDPDSELTRRLARVLDEHWKLAQLEIGYAVRYLRIFDTGDAPQRIAACMKREAAPFDALRRRGVAAPHGIGLMQEAHMRFVDMLAPEIGRGHIASALKLLDWINPPGRNGQMEGAGAKLAIEALLTPWRGREPSPELKDAIRSRLIDAYGDPRLARAGAWSACAPEAKQVILKWTIGATIKLFFEIVQVADPTRQCEERMKLWYGLCDENRIDEAWFVLNGQGAEHAMTLATQPNGPGITEFGRNRSRNANYRKKCLLIMRIRNRWVVEGSSNYKTRIFRPNDNVSVKPYREAYDCEKFVRHPKVDAEIIHWPMDAWRNNVLKAIHR